MVFCILLCLRPTCFFMHITLKQVLSILTIFILLFPNFARVWIVVDFSLHQDYIAKVLCANKDVIGSTCNGKCHLKKQLKQTEEDTHNKTTTTFEENILSNYYLPTEHFSYGQQLIAHNKVGFCFSPAFKKSPYNDNLFRPPQFDTNKKRS